MACIWCSMFGCCVTMAALACAGPSWPHTLGFVYLGSWRARGARSQWLASLVAATNPGKSWRSLGLKSPSGYWCVGVSRHIQHSVHWGGGGYADCGGRCLSGSAPSASRVGAGSSPVAVSRRVRPPIDPFEYRWRHALLQVCGATICLLFGGGGGTWIKIDERSNMYTVYGMRRRRRKFFSHDQKMFLKPRFSGALELRGEGGEGVQGGGVPPPLPE